MNGTSSLPGVRLHALVLSGSCVGVLNLEVYLPT
jgi:hypothetical protein